jgi:hypothetical protein
MGKFQYRYMHQRRSVCSYSRSRGEVHDASGRQDAVYKGSVKKSHTLIAGTIYLCDDFINRTSVQGS